MFVARFHATGGTGAVPPLSERERDVLRGAYVALEYDIEEINTGTLAEPPHFTKPLVGQTVDVWLVLNNSPTGWAVSRVLEQKPATIGKDEVLMRAKWKYARDLQTTTPQGAAEPIRDLFTVDIGADRYFAEEARAKALEKAIRDKQFQVVLSVGGDGRPVIKGLVLDGVRSDETFF